MLRGGTIKTQFAYYLKECSENCNFKRTVWVKIEKLPGNSSNKALHRDPKLSKKNNGFISMPKPSKIVQKEENHN